MNVILKQYIPSVLLALLLTACSDGLWALSWRSVGPGLSYHHKTLPVAGVTLHLLRVDPKRYQWRLLQNPPGQRSSIGQLVDGKKVVAAINGSFFDKKGQPLGLLVDQGKAYQPLRPVEWGVFFLQRGQPAIIHTKDYDSNVKPELALQSGPRLVIAGRVPTYKDQKTAPRSGICVTPQRQVILAIAESPGLTLKDFATELQPHCQDALNLDGGPSTQFWLQTPKQELHIRGWGEIPNALAIIAP